MAQQHSFSLRFKSKFSPWVPGTQWDPTTDFSMDIPLCSPLPQLPLPPSTPLPPPLVSKDDPGPLGYLVFSVIQPLHPGLHIFHFLTCSALCKHWFHRTILIKLWCHHLCFIFPYFLLLLSIAHHHIYIYIYIYICMYIYVYIYTFFFLHWANTVQTRINAFLVCLLSALCSVSTVIAGTEFYLLLNLILSWQQ